MFPKKEVEIMEVRKRDGSTEPFMSEKVVVSAVKSGAPYEDAREIAASLSSRSESVLESSEIREYVISELNSRGHSSAVKHWEEYDRARKSTA